MVKEGPGVDALVELAISHASVVARDDLAGAHQHHAGPDDTVARSLLVEEAREIRPALRLA